MEKQEVRNQLIFCAKKKKKKIQKKIKKIWKKISSEKKYFLKQNFLDNFLLLDNFYFQTSCVLLNSYNNKSYLINTIQYNTINLYNLEF